MRILLDTNIIIYREASYAPRREIGTLFRWLDQLHYEKCIHPETVAEIRRHEDNSVVDAFEAKITNYHLIKTLAPENDQIRSVRFAFDKNTNDNTDSSLLNEVFSGRVTALITEDRKIHKKAAYLGIAERVFTIDSFLEKVIVENPELADYKVLSVKKEYFGNIEITDGFFDTFRMDYSNFENWFNRKADEVAYVCKSDQSEIVAFLYLKFELENENYFDIIPVMSPGKRLKIGTLKVVSNGFKLGERFLKIIFDNGLRYAVNEIYVTMFNHTSEQNRLAALLYDWGFKHWGIKRTIDGEEDVFVRDFRPYADKDNPCMSYPYIQGNAKKYIVPIYPEYHTELFPDSILNTESPLDYVESKPNRNAISKVYISRSIERRLSPGDIILFYRTKSGGSAYYTSVITTIGVVQNVITDIQSEKQFVELCRKRSVFSDKELRNHWNYKRNYRPFIVNFLYVYSFPRRMNLKALIAAGIIGSPEIVPRGFEEVNDTNFQRILEGSNADRRFIVY